MEGTLSVQDLTTIAPSDSSLRISREPIHGPNGDRSRYQTVEISDPLTSNMSRLARGADCDPLEGSRHGSKEVVGSPVAQSEAFNLFQITERRCWRWLERLALRERFGYESKPGWFLTRFLSQVAVWKFHSHLQQRDWIPFRGPGRLLNIGHRNAIFQERMRSFGWTVTEIEPELCIGGDCELDQSVAKTETLQSQQGMAPESFDALTLWHVVQQQSNPTRLLRNAAQLLRPGGLMVIEVPNIDSVTFAEFGEHWPGLHQMRYHFSPKSVRSTFPLDLVRIVEMQQIGINSWILESARRAAAAGRTCYQSWLKRGKSFWDEKALRSEIANQADGLRIIAERRS